MKMIFAEYLVLSSLVLGVQLFLHQSQRIQFVEVNDTAKIHCSSTEDLKGGGWKVFWYLRREGEKPTCIKHCFDDQNVSKFACKHERHSSTLEISTIQKTESGIYYCAYKYSSYLIFGNGSSLIVGAPASKCSHYIVPLAAGAGLLLLVVSLSLVWTLCPSTLGFQPRVSAPPASEEPQMLGVQLLLYQTQRIQFVEVSDTAKIHCSSTENLEGGGEVFWYLRREDSYANSSWVMLLVPFPRGSQVTGTANLACVIHGVSSPVHVSWSVSGELQEQGLTRSLKAKDGSLTLINHISVPRDTWTSGKNFTCEIKFNSSGSSVKKSTKYPAAEHFCLFFCFLHSPCQGVLTLHCAPCGWSWSAAPGGVSEPRLDPLPFHARIPAQGLSTPSFRGATGN
ncbi:unnamed protein product, partial [Lepidochelys olivacea]